MRVFRGSSILPSCRPMNDKIFPKNPAPDSCDARRVCDSFGLQTDPRRLRFALPELFNGSGPSHINDLTLCHRGPEGVPSRTESETQPMTARAYLDATRPERQSNLHHFVASFTPPLLRLGTEPSCFGRHQAPILPAHAGLATVFALVCSDPLRLDIGVILSSSRCTHLPCRSRLDGSQEGLVTAFALACSDSLRLGVIPPSYRYTLLHICLDLSGWTVRKPCRLQGRASHLMFCSLYLGSSEL